ncbi:MAG: hypothetical protein RRC07_02775 [Anaerolineae bacterium]|nr:hypothetical protein [Anaerolineae bacterium]
MNDELQLIMEKIPSQREANALVERLFVVAEPGAVYSEPVTQGEYTVITAREVTIGLGFGFGGGGGTGPGEDEESAGEERASSVGAGYGTGGGGGGTAAGRPVAVIEIGPSGVRVEPIVDPTKISIALFTAAGSMGFMLLKMLQQMRGD